MNKHTAPLRPPRRELTNTELFIHLVKIVFYHLYMTLSILFMELILRFSIYYDTPLTFRKFFYLFAFSLAYGLLITTVAMCFSRKGNRIVHYVSLSFLTILFWVQYGYFHFFGAFFRWSTIGMANEVTDFYREALQMIRANWFAFVLLTMPLLFYILYMRRYAAKRRAMLPKLGIQGGTVLFVYVLAVVVVSLNRMPEHFSDYDFYNYLTPVESVDRFGLLTETRQDLKELLFGAKEIEINLDQLTETVDNPFDVPDTKVPPPDTGGDTPGSDTSGVEPPPVIEYGYNVLEIDWDALISGESDKTIRDMHTYFSTVSPTKQNEYTGMFAGKNLIMLTLEGFSGKVLELAPDLFPTMTKMASEGFVFENYYHGVWGGSTASGEYANMSGLFYKDANCLKNTADNYMPFMLGNQFKELGYTTLAFHNWRAEYYSRHLSHPNYGYDYYAYDPNKALNASKRLDFSAYVSGSKGYDWPMSDDILALLSIPYLPTDEPFHAYYMTVSGHATYSWGGNSMSRKHRAEVTALGLPYSETILAYIAANMEVEAMLTRLCNALEEAGILEDTVFVMATDHYPYGLTYNASTDEYDYSFTTYLAELYGISENNIMNNPELYKNSLILWSASMEEPVHVSTPCSAIDILPTLSNLFGLAYDSRLMIGCDVLSNPDNLVILNCDGTGSAWNWINRYGYYNTASGKFSVNEGVSVDTSKLDTYISQMNTIVKAKRKYSYLVLEKDYYRYLEDYIG